MQRYAPDLMKDPVHMLHEPFLLRSVDYLSGIVLLASAAGRCCLLASFCE